MPPRIKQPSGTILDKLSELGIAQDVDADEAAIGQISEAPVDETDDEEESDDPLDAVDGGLSDDEDTFENPAPLRSNLRDKLFAESERKPVGRPRKQPPVQQQSAPIGYSAPEPAPYAPIEPVAIPQPRVAGKVNRGGVPQAAVSRGMGRLASKMPGAETIVVHKRNDRQQLAFIGRYSPKDLTGFANVEMFVFDMIKPKFGAGEYQIMGLDAMGREINAGSCIIEDPPSKTNDQSMVELVQTLLKKEETVSQAPIPPVNPINLLKDVHELQKSMAAPQPVAPPKDDSTIAAVISAQGQQMQAMMQMMQAQNSQTTQLLIAAMQQPKEDPMMKMLLAKLVEEKSSSGLGNMPLPPPLPPADPMAGITQLIAALAPFIAPMLKNKGGDETNDLLKTLISQKESETLKPKEVIELMTTMSQANKGSDDFRKSVENLGMMMQISKGLNAGNEGSSSAGFFDALAALFSNRDFAGSIAQAVRAKAETAQKKEVINAETHLLEKKGQLLEKMRNGRPSQPPAAVVRPAAPAQGPVPTQQHPNVVQMPQRPVQQAPQQPQFRLPPLPSGTPEHVQGLLTAKDDGELLGKTVQMLLYFAEHKEWAPMAEMLLGTIAAGERDKSINIVRNVFTGFAQMGVMPQELAIRVCNSFIANFDVIRSQVVEMNLAPAEESEDPFEAALETETDEESDEDEEEDEEGDDEDESDEEEPEAEKEPVAG